MKIFRKNILDEKQKKISWDLSRHWKYSVKDIEMLTKQANFEIVSKGGVSFLPTSNSLISLLEKYTDHIDDNRDDNRDDNLDDTTREVNMLNEYLKRFDPTSYPQFFIQFCLF